MSEIETAFCGPFIPLSADMTAWLTEALSAMVREHPDATMRLITTEDGMTIEAVEMRPVVVQRLSSPKEKTP